MSETIHLTVRSQPPVGLTTEQARVINAVSPTAEVERVDGGAVLTVHDLNGTTTATLYDGAQGAQGPAGPAGQDGAPGRDGVDGSPGAPGQDGADGVSPTVTVTDITGGHRVTITDADGTKTMDVMDGVDGADGQPGQAGADGQDGADGFSPTASVIKSGDTATITITDKTGTTTATVSDGAAGATGPQGPQGEPGEDYVLTAQDKQDIAGMVDVPSVATAAEAKAGQNASHYLAPSLQDASAFYGLCKAAGDTTQSSSSNAVGQYTDAAKVAIQKMLGIYEAPWELIREDTVTHATDEGLEITVDSNGQAFELTDIRLLIQIPTQETDFIITNYALITAGSSDDSSKRVTFSLSGGNPYTVTANSNSKIALYEVTTENGMSKLEGYEIQNESGRATQRVPAYYPNTSNYREFQLNTFSFNKISISSFTGTMNYKLYGRRKWN